MIMDLKKAELGLRKNVYVATSDNETTLYGFFDMLKYKTILPLRVKMELQHITVCLSTVPGKQILCLKLSEIVAKGCRVSAQLWK